MEYPLTFEQYQQGLREGKLMGLHCQSCEAYTVPPRGSAEIARGKTCSRWKSKARERSAPSRSSGLPRKANNPPMFSPWSNWNKDPG